VDSIINVLVAGLVAVIDLATAPLPFLASSGALLVILAGAWIAFGVALVRAPGRIDQGWRRLRATPAPVQGIAWLAFLPVLAAAWAWRTGWPAAVRLTMVTCVAGWSLLVLMPSPA
jgi:hypothetical protein